MTDKLILIRHSLPEINPAIPPNEWILSEEGRKRAGLLARQLTAYSFNCLMSSYEPKAVATATIIANYFDSPVEIVPGLHEHERPDPTFMSQQDFRKTISQMFVEPTSLSFGTETASEAGQRFDKVVQCLLRRSPDQGLAIVAHGTVMAMFTAMHSKNDPYRIWQRLTLPGALIFSLPDLQLISRLALVDKV